MLNPITIFIVFAAYTLLLLLISFITSRKSDNASFFIGNKSSKWYVVAYGMIGASLSGVTFISIPGSVGGSQMTYMVIVLGYLVGYAVIANVLLPIYYRLNLISIYTYLEQRFGFWSYKTGAAYFLISRLIGASFRMFLVVNVLHVFVFSLWGIPFWASLLFFMVLMILYTFKGGIKTIVWTDTLQTTFMLLSIGISIFLIKDALQLSFGEFAQVISESDFSRWLDTDITSRRHFLKQFVSGAFIAIVMTGLDQDMMQKNLSCKTLKESQKNMFFMSLSLVPVNFLILILGATLFIFAQTMGIEVPARTDNLFPLIALKHLTPFAGVIFMIGLISAAYSSADSALTALTTSFSIDFLQINKKEQLSEKAKQKTRHIVHIGMGIAVFFLIILFKILNNESVINQLFTIAGYTYGPLLGLFTFGIFTQRKAKDKAVPIISLVSPAVCYLLSIYSQEWFWGYRFGFELLVINGLITFVGLWVFSKR